MSVRKNPEAATILNDIGNLYLNKNYSDVTFVVGGEKLPAHRNILSQRCPVFNTLFLEGEPVGELVKLKEAPVDALKMFLKFIYTGTVDLDVVNVNILFETVKLASAFEMPKLEEICVERLTTICASNNATKLVNTTFKKSSGLTKFCLDYIDLFYAKVLENETFKKVSVEVQKYLIYVHVPELLKYINLNDKLGPICVKHLKNVCNIDNITSLVNATFEKSTELTEFYLEYMDKHYAKLVEHETFNKLSVEVLKGLFKEFNVEAPHDVISKSVVDWMKANPSEFAQFPELLKNVKLNAIALNDLINNVRSLKLIEDKDMSDVVYEHVDWEDEDTYVKNEPRCSVM